MPRYAFEARDTQGGVVHGFESAGDMLDLDRRLAKTELLLVGAKESKPPRRRSSSGRALIDFCYHLAVVVEAGIPLLQGLHDLRDAEESALSDAVADVARKVEAGSTLSDAMGERPGEFPRYVRALVRAGENTGSLPQILHDLVKYLEWREDLSRQIRSASTYPTIVVLGVFGLCAIITVYVLPNFLQIFAELNVELPLATRALMGIDAFLSAHGALVFGIVAALVIGTVFYVRTRRGRRAFDGLVLRTPLLGRLVLMIEASRFSHNLGVMYASGLPIHQALELLEEIVQNVHVRELVQQMRERISRGETLCDALGRTELMPLIVLRMVAVGERSGKLDESLERAASFYDREVPVIIARALAVFNTGALVFLGASLVTIGLALFVPLYQMMGNLGATP